MVSIDASVKMISTSPNPIVFMDTCSILDIIRFPLRADNPKDLILDAQEIISSPTFIVINDLIEQEWNENNEKVLEEVRKYIKTQNSGFKKIRDSIHAFDQSVPETFSLENFDLSDKLYKLTQELLNKSIKLEVSSSNKEKGFDRIANNVRPARKGKNEIKDCGILENLLEFVDKIRACSCSNPIFFITSNKDDYGVAPILYEPIKTEFSTRGIEYVSDMSWLKSEITRLPCDTREGGQVNTVRY